MRALRASGTDIMQGIAGAAGEVGTMDEQDSCEPGQTAPITVAGRTIGNPLVAVTGYLKEHPGTVTHQTSSLARAVRSQPNSSRRRGCLGWPHGSAPARGHGSSNVAVAAAPWGQVAPDALLQDADAAQPGGLYDAASALWEHFWTERPEGVATAKISKVLYLMRPALFPIVDHRLRSFYGPASKAAARDVASRRPEFAACKRLTWEAVRRDLLGNQAAVRELRGALGDIDCALASEASAKLSDLRLLDMLAWAA
jgi:Family of unknown function (DUF6308)